ncbi:MAG: dprA [Microbacteriaceae bacterium]|nr:dprA [Microbacteriaceae bacterium]
MFALAENEITPLVTAVAGGDLDRGELERLFALAAWSGIVEPGDGTAGLVVALLGAPTALRVMLNSPSATDLGARLRECGAEVDRSVVEQAIERWMPRVSSTAAVHSLRQAARASVRLMVPGDDRWPTGVDDLGVHAPLTLWFRGTEFALRSLDRSFALVGARAATGYGEHVAMEAAAGLVDRGYSIVSGAAYGIDGMAHRAALASRGQTIAFLAGGVDRFYPSGHDALLTRIAENGAVISELPCGSPPTKWRFLQRNRLIAASSLATIVLEAGWRSGSLNTAGHAAALGRPVGAVPGPVTSAASAGCHRLIREHGAVCVTNADEMGELAPLHVSPALFSATEAGGADSTSGSGAATSTDETRLFDALSFRSPRQAVDIAARSGLPLGAVRSLLGMLELEGRTAERERGWVRVKPDDER